jgi:hypothetical protein
MYIAMNWMGLNIIATEIANTNPNMALPKYTTPVSYTLTVNIVAS